VNFIYHTELPELNTNCDEEDIVQKLYKFEFLHELRREVALIHNPNPDSKLCHVKMWEDENEEENVRLTFLYLIL
jgi:hypothetical protein